VASRCPEVLLGGLDEPRSTSRSVIHMPTVTFTEVEAASSEERLFHGNTLPADPYCYKSSETCNRGQRVVTIENAKCSTRPHFGLPPDFELSVTGDDGWQKISRGKNLAGRSPR
jgi:hypothetical protein